MSKKHEDAAVAQDVMHLFAEYWEGLLGSAELSDVSERTPNFYRALGAAQERVLKVAETDVSHGRKCSGDLRHAVEEWKRCRDALRKNDEELQAVRVRESKSNRARGEAEQKLKDLAVEIWRRAGAASTLPPPSVPEPVVPTALAVPTRARCGHPAERHSRPAGTCSAMGRDTRGTEPEPVGTVIGTLCTVLAGVLAWWWYGSLRVAVLWSVIALVVAGLTAGGIANLWLRRRRTRARMSARRDSDLAEAEREVEALLAAPAATKEVAS